MEAAVARKANTTPSRDVTLPTRHQLKRLQLSPEVAYYLLTRGYDLDKLIPPATKTPEPRLVKGAAFDPARVDHVIKSFRQLRHTQGRLAGKVLEPDAWQVAYILAPVFGWVRKNDAEIWVRIIRNLYVDVPRKNGKTTLGGGISIYLTAADGEQGAQVLAAASRRDQARYVFDPIKLLAERAPALKGHVRPFKEKIIHPRTGSYFAVVSSVGDAIHGANVHGALIDELHVHKSPDLVDAIETGTGARDQPLVVIITTAGDGKPGTIYERKRKHVEKVASGIFNDDTTYGVIWAASEDDDPFAVETQRKANPGFGISPTREFLADAANKAKSSPVELARYKRLHLGIRTRQTTEFIPLTDWRRNAGTRMALAEAVGNVAFAGMDLASVSDISAVCYLIRKGDSHEDGYRAFWRFWIPEESLPDLNKSTSNAAATWVEAGWIETTPGDVTDYEFIKAAILEDAATLGEDNLESLGYDPWNATQIAVDLAEEGVPMVETRQGYRTQSPALKEVLRLVKKGRRGQPLIEHGGNPVMEWMVSNLAVDTDPAGNVKPNKRNSADKIDGVSALTNAMAEAMLSEPENRSAYADGHGLDVAKPAAESGPDTDEFGLTADDYI